MYESNGTRPMVTAELTMGTMTVELVKRLNVSVCLKNQIHANLHPQHFQFSMRFLFHTLKFDMEFLGNYRLT